MTPEAFRESFDYVVWGDRRMLAAARGLSDEAYHRDHGFSMGSVHNLLVHMMAAQDVWLRRWQRESKPRMLTPQDVPTRAALEAKWPIVRTGLLEFVSSRTQADLDETLHYHNNAGQPFSAPLKVLMAHVADHATYHRGQLNSMIKLSGGAPVPVMVVARYYEQTGQS
jgi:uncharacterized damage-inducible protein DinB